MRRGCVTPKQIENLSAVIGGNYGSLDGYGIIQVGDQARVRKALDDDITRISRATQLPCIAKISVLLSKETSSTWTL